MDQNQQDQNSIADDIPQAAMQEVPVPEAAEQGIPLAQAPQESGPVAPAEPEDTPIAEQTPGLDDLSTQEVVTDRAVVPRKTTSEHVKQEYLVFKPLPDPFDPEAITMFVPTTSGDEVAETIIGMTSSEQKDLVGNQRFVGVMGASAESIPKLDFHGELDERENSQWRQLVPNPNNAKVPLGVSRPFINEDDVTVSGSAAVQRLRLYTGQGTAYNIPLWHSGFWITVRSPSNSELLELDRQLADSKVRLGRATTGLLYSNESVFMANHLVRFVLGHIETTTLKNSTHENILKLMDIHDLQTLAWGMACAIWPSGFQYARSILGETPAQNKVVEGLLNLSKIQWVDTSALTDEQIRHFSNQSVGRMTNEDVESYKRKFVNRERQITINERVRVNLEVPSVEEHLASGMAWVNSIVTLTDRVFGMDQNEDERNNYISNQGKAVILRQYGHWVKSVVLGKGLVTDPNTIIDLLNDLSSADTLRDKLMNEIIQYAEDTTFAYIAVPTTNEGEENILPRAPHLLPIDALSTFFILLKQRVVQILKNRTTETFEM